MSFGINSLSDAMVGIRILDAAGTPLTLRHVPEPGTLALLGLASGLWMTRRRGRTHAPRNAQ